MGLRVHLPHPGYNQPHLKKYKKTNLPVVEKITSKILGLPMFFKLQTKQQDIVIHEIKSAIIEAEKN